MTRHLTIALAVLLAACSDDGPGNEQPTSDELFGSATTRVVVEVDYADGAEPTTGGGVASDDPWELLEGNLNALFDGTKELTVPHALDEMEAIGAVEGESFDANALLALADAHRDQLSGDGVATFYVVYVDGFYDKGGEAQQNVLGVSVGDTGVVAMFAPVIRSAGGPVGLVERYVEQAVLVHELGHAVGLVNNGLSLTSEHHDAEHGAHCSNEDCVMYWTVEGVSGAVDFVQEYVTSGNTILFGGACLGDAHAALR